MLSRLRPGPGRPRDPLKSSPGAKLSQGIGTLSLAVDVEAAVVPANQAPRGGTMSVQIWDVKRHQGKETHRLDVKSGHIISLEHGDLMLWLLYMALSFPLDLQ